MLVFLWILLGVVGFVFVFFVLPIPAVLLKTMPIAKMVYNEQLVRESPDKWKRENSCPSDAEYSAMYSEAEAWGERYADCTQEVTVQNDGLTLCGRFTDFGAKKTAIILCGRAEGCIYSYFYAEPYRKAGWNILVVDQRAHGNSEGKYSGMGWLERKDILAWMRLLEERFHTEAVLLHGVCIGAACATYVAANPASLPLLKGIVVDGLYYSFHEVFRARFHTNNKPIFPVLIEIEMLIKRHTGIDIQKIGPYRSIKNVQVPVLFIHSKEDVSSLPKFVPGLYDSCPTEKTLVWMDHGAHSHLRAVNRERYDEVVTAFANGLHLH